MSFRAPYTSADVDRFRRLGDVTPGGLTFNWELSGPGGARFELLREPHHTDGDIEQAKRELHAMRDVVGRIAVSRVQSKDTQPPTENRAHEDSCPIQRRFAPRG